MNSKGNIYVVSGPSGVGKGTVVKQVIEQSKASDNSVALSVSATTRKPREGEIDGVHYYFMSEDEFLKTAAKGGFMEYAEYCGHYYGTPRDKVLELADKGTDIILEIEVQGGMQVLDALPQAYGIFLLPPSFGELERRLRSRESEPEEVIEQRLETAHAEISQSYRYEYFVVNDTVENAAGKILDIIAGNRKCE